MGIKNKVLENLLKLGVDNAKQLLTGVDIAEPKEGISKTAYNAKAKAESMRLFRQEASRKTSLANKRLKRLEERGLQDSPAYKAIMENGGKFGVRGKTFNEVQGEMARLNKFIDANTSTIRGVNKHLTEMADITGITYDNVKELQTKAPKFFELSSKVEQYLRMMEDSATAIGYQKIWEAINVYVEETNLELAEMGGKVEGMIELISNRLMEEARTPKTSDDDNWFKLE